MNVHSDAREHGRHAHTEVVSAARAAKDPVCGMTIDPQKTPYRTTYAAADYFFCSSGCKAKFEATPARYLAGESPAMEKSADPAPAGAIYTCPMHPQIRQPGPGSCPICGMALEPEVAITDTGPSPERVDMERRLWIGLALSVPVVILEMGGHFVDLHRLVPPVISNWVQFALATPVVLWAGWSFFVRAVQS